MPNFCSRHGPFSQNRRQSLTIPRLHKQLAEFDPFWTWPCNSVLRTFSAKRLANVLRMKIKSCGALTSPNRDTPESACISWSLMSLGATSGRL